MLLATAIIAVTVASAQSQAPTGTNGWYNRFNPWGNYNGYYNQQNQPVAVQQNLQLNAVNQKQQKDDQLLLQQRDNNGIQDNPLKPTDKGTACDPKSYRCGHKSPVCVNYKQLCDGVAQCENGADETALVCALRNCTEDEFDCGAARLGYGRCVPKSKVCNRHEDCVSKADEANCEVPKCHDDQFQCKSTLHCIPKQWRCDKIVDCRDTSDEQGCHVTVTEKPQEKIDSPCDSDIAQAFHCRSGTVASPKNKKIMDKLYGANCVPIWYVCNGNDDCTDGADEKAAVHFQECKNTTDSVEEGSGEGNDTRTGIADDLLPQS